jgi:hypothetical protein
MHSTEFLLVNTMVIYDVYILQGIILFKAFFL